MEYEGEMWVYIGVFLLVIVSVTFMLSWAHRHGAESNSKGSVAGITLHKGNTEQMVDELITELLLKEQKLFLNIKNGKESVKLGVNELNILYDLEKAVLLAQRDADKTIYVEIIRSDEMQQVIDQVLVQLGVHDIEVTEARLEVTDDKVQVIGGTNGKVYDREAIAEDIYVTVYNLINKISIDSTVDVNQHSTIIEPIINTEMASDYESKLGSARTDSNGNSISRDKNMSLACEKIDGTLLMPGRIFSVYKQTQPYTAEEGYELAGVLRDGLANTAIGGGVCQVATTLYNAVIRAELEVVQRYNHSAVSTYVAPAFDATVASEHVDFKFKNNLKNPVFIRAVAEGGTVIMEIYGKEERNTNRTIKFDGIEVREGKYELRKSVYIDDELQSVEVMNESIYRY